VNRNRKARNAKPASSRKSSDSNARFSNKAFQRHATIAGASHQSRCQFGCANNAVNTPASAPSCQPTASVPITGMVMLVSPICTQPRPNSGSINRPIAAPSSASTANAPSA